MTGESTELFADPALTLNVKVAGYDRISQDVVALTLESQDGSALPGWDAGAHIDLVLPSGLRRSYSLCGPTAASNRYNIAILREDSGRGGSREIHETELLGRQLQVTVPRNAFALEPAEHYVFIAGGIGITPIITMVRKLVAANHASWQLHYLGRSRAAMSFLSEVEELVRAYPGRVHIAARDEAERVSLQGICDKAPAGTAIYACGPNRMLDQLQSLEEAMSGRTLHVERFGRPELSEAEAAPGVGAPLVEAETIDPDGSFTVELRASGKVLTVPAGTSILECARRVRTGLSFSCSEGYCGTCETRVISGIPDHRDSVLTDEEKAASKSMMICISRARTSRLILDL